MAKKKALEPIPPGPKHVRLELSEELQHDLRMLAAEHKLSMAAYARAALASHIAQVKAEKQAGPK